MKIRFTESGGFVGILRHCDVDTALLPVDERARVEQLVSDAALCESCERLSDAGRDLEQYEIAIEHRQSSVLVVFDSVTLSKTARPLVAYLKNRVRLS